MDGLKYAAQVERMRLLRLTVFMTVMAFIECGLCHLLKENIDLK